jgi:hypothetical protein
LSRKKRKKISFSLHRRELTTPQKDGKKDTEEVFRENNTITLFFLEGKGRKIQTKRASGD